MRTSVLTVLVALGLAAFTGTFLWGAFRPPPAVQAPAEGAAPTASATGALSDGRLDVQVFALGNRQVRLDIQYVPESGKVAGLRPDVTFAMLEMHMNDVDPPLQLVDPGVWRADVELPMAGRWVVNVGFSEEFVEVEFDAR